MLGDTRELLFLVARDFVKLNKYQQVGVGMKLGLVGVDAAMWDHEAIAQTVFTKAYKAGKLKELVVEMRHYLYE